MKGGWDAGRGTRPCIYMEPNSNEVNEMKMTVTDVFPLTTPVFPFIYIGLVVSLSS